MRIMDKNQNEEVDDGGTRKQGYRKRKSKRPADLSLTVITEENEVRSPSPMNVEITAKQTEKSNKNAKTLQLIQQLPKFITYCGKTVLSPIPENREYKKKQNVLSPSPMKGITGKSDRLDTPTFKSQTFRF